MREINADVRINGDKRGPLTRAVLFHDLSGFGKCSITTGLPILAAAGVEAACVPTAVLSTHTGGGFTGYTFRDLTEDLPAFLNNWNELGIHFDCVYSGYLGTPGQAEILKGFIEFQRKRNPKLLVVIDPVMGDHGVLYTGFGELMVEAMRGLMPLADVALPNMTEACALLGREYVKGPYTPGQAREVCVEMSGLGPKAVVLTGLELEDEKIGTAVYDKDGAFEVIASPKVPGEFHGTGDVFASFLTGAVLNGMGLADAAFTAARLTYGAALRTAARGTARRDGVDFEEMLPEYMEALGIIGKGGSDGE